MTRVGRCGWVWLFCVLTAMAASAQTFTTLASFQYDGANPEYVSLIQASDGNFYGTTRLGGGAGLGVAFQFTPGGNVTDFCNFGQGACYGGIYPFAGIIQAADGNFYGTTWQGGANSTGTVFEILPGGTLAVLHSFCSENNCADGEDPMAPLIQTADGSFYGTAVGGGTKGYGTVFKLTLSGTLTTLHSFRFKDGASPVAGLIRAKNGKFYGTTLFGGTKGGGAVFEMTATGKLKTLYSFCLQKKCTDGANPYAGLVQAADGSFYGTTFAGGAHGHGTVFRITPAGKLTTLYSFCSQKNCTDGAEPYAGVIQATDGNFYGTTSKGGTKHWGTIYEISSTGQWTTLHSFCAEKNCTDGAEPSGGLLQATSGIFYGTTTYGGTSQEGTVYSLSMGLAPRRNGRP